MVVTMMNAVFWDVTPCGSCKNRCFRGTYGLHHQSHKNWQAKHGLVASIANVPRSPILVALMMGAKRSSDTPVLTRATWCNFPEDGILH
jgi:heterodisulfide reductase subunit C